MPKHKRRADHECDWLPEADDPRPSEIKRMCEQFRRQSNNRGKHHGKRHPQREEASGIREYWVRDLITRR